MIQEPINVILLGIVIFTYAGLWCLAWSPDALERVGRRLRARGRAIVASREAWGMAHDQSMLEDFKADTERGELRRLFVEERQRQIEERAS